MLTHSHLRPPDLESLKTFFQNVPSPVAVVTAWAQEPTATTVSSFISLSIDPQLVLVALAADSSTLAAAEQTGRLGVNVLSEAQSWIGSLCATKSAAKLGNLPWQSSDGLPRIDGAVGWMACDVAEVRTAGDHRLLILRPTAIETTTARAVTYFRRGFHGIGELTA